MEKTYGRLNGKKGRDIEQHREWNENHLRIKAYLLGNPHATVKEMEANLPMNRDTISRHLKIFAADGEIIRRGKKFTVTEKMERIMNLQHIKKILDKAEKWDLSCKTNADPDITPITEYEICKPVDTKNWLNLDPKIAKSILDSFRKYLKKNKLKSKDFPEKILVAYVINIKELTHSMKKKK